MRKSIVIMMVATLMMMVAVGQAEEATKDTEHEFDKADFTKIAKKTIGAVISGNVNPDKMIADMEHLLELGIAGCEEHMNEPETPDVEKRLMKQLVTQAKILATLSLEDIEKLWHDGGYAKKEGIDIHKFDHFDEVMCHYDAVVHPATAIICLNEYKKDNKEEHLDQVKDELTEVVEHMKHLD